MRSITPGSPEAAGGGMPRTWRSRRLGLEWRPGLRGGDEPLARPMNEVPGSEPQEVPMTARATLGSHLERAPGDHSTHSHDVLRYMVPLGRVLFAAIFVMAAPGHFAAPTIAFAAQQGVPLASLLVPLSGVLALLGGLSVLLGYRAKLGAWLIVLFLIPVTLAMHAFWKVADPTMAQMQQAMFMKNLSMLGAALLIAYFGAGPLSLDARHR